MFQDEPGRHADRIDDSPMTRLLAAAYLVAALLALAAVAFVAFVWAVG
jgi:hypothetical protein